MQNIVNRFAEALKQIDYTGIPHKRFQPGIGPYGEPQAVKLALEYLKNTYLMSSREP